MVGNVVPMHIVRRQWLYSIPYLKRGRIIAVGDGIGEEVEIRRDYL